MAPEFSEVLLPSDKEKMFTTTVPNPKLTWSVKTPSPNISFCCVSKWLGIFAALAGFFMLTILMASLFVRYENKLAQYETRISILEEELGIFLQQFESYRVEPETVGEMEDDGYMMEDDEDNSSSYEEEDAQAILFPKIPSDRIEPEVEKEDKDIGKMIFGELTTEPLRRQRRQIPTSQFPQIPASVERTRSGVPVLEGSYSSRPSASHGFSNSFEQHPTEGLRIYESLITTGGRGEPKASEFAESDGSNVQPYHRTSAAWTEDPQPRPERTSRLEVKSGDSNLSGGLRIGGGIGAGATGSLRQSGSSHQQTRPVSSGPSVIQRSSRVPTTGEYNYLNPTRTTQSGSTYQYPPLKRIGQGDGEVIARVHQEDDSEQQGPDHATASATHGEAAQAHAESRTYKARPRGRYQSYEQSRARPSRIHNRRQEEAESDEVSFVKAEAWTEGPTVIAAHYVSDASNYTTAHRHYEGNGRLKNADGIFAAWKAADWMASADGHKGAFELSGTGVLTVKKQGLYYIYAQIHYLDDHDINGFQVQVNSEPFLQCTRMTETASSSKSNTCFTGGINYLKGNDRIVIRDIETNRFSIIKPEKTFFGLMRIGDTGGGRR